MGPLKACVHENLLEIAIDTEGLAEKVCADCGERFSVTDEEKKEWEEEQVKLRRCILYTIQPTDSVVGIAKRFGVDLRRLVELNPQVCTPGPQAGIEIKIPVGDGPVKRLFFRLLELYRDEAPNVFAMLYQIAEVSHNTEIGLEATIDNAVSHFEAGYIAGAFDCLGITKNPSVMYLEYANPITKPQKRLAELKEIRRTYRAVVEQSDPKKDPITEIAEHREKCIYRTLRDGKINIDEINKYN